MAKEEGNGVLYVVATPIGNLADITLRALRVLREVDYVACEDTRVTRQLLSYYRISKRLLSCRAANEKGSAHGLVKLLKQGQSVAYLSDAGTPGISDPGAALVRVVRASGCQVVPLPGASALSCLLSVSGASSEFFFAGFLPQRGRKREMRLRELLSLPCAVVLYESTHRLIKFFETLLQIDPHRKIFIGKEMTKKFEWYECGTASFLLEKITDQVKIRGEFALLLYPDKIEASEGSDESL